MVKSDRPVSGDVVPACLGQLWVATLRRSEVAVGLQTFEFERCRTGTVSVTRDASEFEGSRRLGVGLRWTTIVIAGTSVCTWSEVKR